MPHTPTPLPEWWVTRVAVGAAAVVLVLTALRLVFDVLALLTHVLLLVLFGIVIAIVLAFLNHRSVKRDAAAHVAAHPPHPMPAGAAD